jgi:subtilisin family serine protease
MAWNHDFVRLPEALALVGGGRAGGAIAWGAVRVGHLDTGFTRHPVLGPWAADGSSPIVRVADGLNLIDPAQPPFDDGSGTGAIRNPGHGTKTMSVLSGRASGDFAGCAPGLPVVPYRAVDDVFLDPHDFADAAWAPLGRALRHAVNVARCPVVSISLGGFGPPREFGEAVDHAYEQGTIVVAAAGQLTDRVTYPGRYSRVVGVGGIARTKRGGFAIYNDDYDDISERIDVWAPADPILRADIKPRDEDPPTGTGDGTSYATPHVAAAAALWLVHHRARLARFAGWRVPEAFWRCLKRSQNLDRMPQGRRRYVNAVLDARKLLEVELPDPLTLEKNEIRAAGERF